MNRQHVTGSLVACRPQGRLRAAIVLLAVALLGLAAAGCGGSATPTPAPAPATPVALGKVRVGISPDWAPWEFVGEAGEQPVGFDVDLMRTVAKEAKFEVEFVQTPFDRLLAGVGSDYDAAISALLVNGERAAKVDFSTDYQKIGLVQVVPSWNRAVWGMADVAGKKAGALRNSPAEAEIKKVDPAAAVLFDDCDAMFAALTADQRSLDVIVCDYLTATEYMAKTPGKLKSGPAFTGDKLAIAVAKSRPDVLAAINAGLKSAVDNYLVKDIVTEWLMVSPDKRQAGFTMGGGR